MLSISNLYVKADKKLILRGVNLEVKAGELVVLFGPNGCGKTSLLKSVVGLSKYKVVKGDIKFGGETILNKSINERNKMGIGLMFQRPPVIDGVRVGDVLEGNHVLEKRLLVSEFLNRSLNDNLSGGEVKRMEMYQMISMKLKLCLFDEPDSGVDVENIKMLAKEINEIMKDKEKSAVLVTHGGQILKYLKPTRAVVMVGGKIICHGDPQRVYQSISKVGYKKCIGCKCKGRCYEK